MPHNHYGQTARAITGGRAALAFAATLGVASAAFAADIVVEVAGLDDDRATVHAELHAAASADWTTPLARTAAATSTLRFADVAPGRYAVQLFVDRDGDGHLAVTTRDVPTEPVGFSGNPSLVTGKPPPAQAAFEHGAAETGLTVRLREYRRR